MLAGNVSSSSTLQVFRNTIHFDGRFACLEFYLIGQFPLPRHVLDSASTRVLESGCRALAFLCQSDLPVPSYTPRSKLTVSLRMVVCVVRLSNLCRFGGCSYASVCMCSVLERSGLLCAFNESFRLSLCDSNFMPNPVM